MADLMTREATPAEAKPVSRFVELVRSKRRMISRVLEGGNALWDCQQWLNSNGLSYGPVFVDSTDGKRLQAIGARASKLEDYASGLETQKLFFRPNADNTEISIFAPLLAESAPVWENVSLGLVPLIIVVAGIVLVAAAITTAIAFYMDAEKEETIYKKRALDLDAWALKQDPATVAAWKQFKEQNRKANPSFWEGLQDTLGGFLPFAAIALVAMVLMKSSSSRSSEA
jgi:hypothetical protein